MNNLEKEIKEYLEERGWNNKMVSDYAKSISIEAAELLEIFQWRAMNADDVKKDSEAFGKVKKELADVLIYCLDIAVALNIHPDEIIREKLAHNKAKFPAGVVKGNSARYYEIKKEYRKRGE